MSNKDQNNGMNRRRFLQTGALATAGIYIGLHSFESFGSTGRISAADIKNVKLNNGIKMPILGFGTYGLSGEVCVKSVTEAIAQGYRLIDTAKVYGNEKEVGLAIKQSGIDRKKLFVTSKLWVDDAGYQNTKKGFEETLAKLGLEYLDLYLIHRPRGDVKGTWKAMEELHNEGKIKAIGISNFDSKQLAELLSYAQIKPAINQIETHAFFQQENDHKELKAHNIQLEAWAPLAEGRHGLFTNEAFIAIGKKHNKTVAQINLRWLYQRDIIAIPRSSQKSHIIENLNIFDFKLDEQDMKIISKLDLDRTQFPEWS
ncbi:aldo/keto reductase [Flavobacterium luteolum]|uniref:aldo/keto reductase n=1 Tax=Flavobacterium luteolum TaxID=3003259 RepID=UPI00248F0990|nr:aldo/keto reductase [Flavobacterium luteolum]